MFGVYHFLPTTCSNSNYADRSGWLLFQKARYFTFFSAASLRLALIRLPFAQGVSQLLQIPLQRIFPVGLQPNAHVPQAFGGTIPPPLRRKEKPSLSMTIGPYSCRSTEFTVNV
jgi:hypothetical protein